MTLDEVLSKIDSGALIEAVPHYAELKIDSSLGLIGMALVMRFRGTQLGRLDGEAGLVAGLTLKIIADMRPNASSKDIECILDRAKMAITSAIKGRD